jgi:hypothetical protein
MYVITQNVSNSTVSGWLATLIQVASKDAESAKVPLDLIKEIDLARTQRNTVVHGTWRAGDAPGFAYVTTIRWDRQEVARDSLWSVADFDDLVSELHDLLIRLFEFCYEIGAVRRS